MVTTANCFRRVTGCSKVSIEFGHPRVLHYHKQQASDVDGAARRRFRASIGITLIGGGIRKSWVLEDAAPGTPV